MDEAIIQEILQGYREIKKEYNLDAIRDSTYAKRKIALFKKYMAYPEEFSYALQYQGGCYLNYIIHQCPINNCSTCNRDKAVDILVKKINHVP